MAYKDIKPYSEFAHKASLHGGPQKYIQDIELNSFIKGRSKGRSEGRLEGLGIGGLLLGIGCVGKILWDKYQEKKIEEKKLEERANVAKTKLMESMEKSDKEVIDK